jgi:hypothetical protein
VNAFFWFIGVYLRVVLWIVAEAVGVVYLALCCALGAINGVLRMLCLAIQKRQLERGTL